MIRDAGKQPMQNQKDKAIKIAEGPPLRRLALQDNELLAKDQDFRLKRAPGPEEPSDRRPDKVQQPYHTRQHHGIRN